MHEHCCDRYRRLGRVKELRSSRVEEHRIQECVCDEAEQQDVQGVSSQTRDFQCFTGRHVDQERGRAEEPVNHVRTDRVYQFVHLAEHDEGGPDKFAHSQREDGTLDYRAQEASGKPNLAHIPITNSLSGREARRKHVDNANSCGKDAGHDQVALSDRGYVRYTQHPDHQQVGRTKTDRHQADRKGKCRVA